MTNYTPDSYLEAKEVFFNFGKCLRVLNRRDPKNDVAKLMYQLFSSDWLDDNIASCLLFSSEPIVKSYLTMIRSSDDGAVMVGRILSSMVVMCGTMDNNLDQGLAKILDWVFLCLDLCGPKYDSIVKSFWQEIGVRFDEDISEEMLVQLGVHVGLKSYSTKNIISSLNHFNGTTEE